MVDVPSDFQGSPMVSAICAWLVAMLPPIEHARFLEEDGKRAWRWSVAQLEKLMEVCLRCHAENTLAAAFFIFQPVSIRQVVPAFTLSRALYTVAWAEASGITFVMLYNSYTGEQQTGGASLHS